MHKAGLHGGKQKIQAFELMAANAKVESPETMQKSPTQKNQFSYSY